MLTIPPSATPMRPLVLALALAATAHAQGLRVVHTSPAPEALAAAPSTDVTVTLAEAVDPASVSAETFRVRGHWSGPAGGTYAIEDDGRRVRFTPARPFSAGEYVVVQVSKGLRSVGGGALPQPHGWVFWVAAGPGSLEQTEVARVPIRRAGEGHIQSYGAYGGDLDGDGWTDIAVPNERADDVRVFLNDGAGGYGPFAVYPLDGGDTPSPIEGADFNRDGRLDLAIGNTLNDRVHVLLGDGAGGFPTQTSTAAASGVRGLALLDLDGDGHDDVVAASRSGSRVTVLRGQGDGTFRAEAPFEVGSQPTAAAVADANGDGLLDVFVGTYLGQEIVALLNDGAGGLAVGGRIGLSGRPWMIAAGDLDGDGRPDVASASSSDDAVHVAFSDGAGGFREAARYPAGQFPIAIDLGDLDGDGDLEVVASHFVTGDWYLWPNDGAGALGAPTVLRATSAASCATLHDRDNDGDLDLTGIDEIDDLMFVFENTGATRAEDEAVASGFGIASVAPNPASAAVTVRFRTASAGPVRLAVYDVRGRAVAVLADGVRPAGSHEVVWDGARAPAGVYLVRLRAGGRADSRAVAVVR